MIKVTTASEGENSATCVCGVKISLSHKNVLWHQPVCGNGDDSCSCGGYVEHYQCPACLRHWNSNCDDGFLQETEEFEN